MDDHDSITIGVNTKRAVGYVEQIASNKTKIHMEYGPRSMMKLTWWMLTATCECFFRRMAKKIRGV